MEVIVDEGLDDERLPLDLVRRAALITLEMECSPDTSAGMTDQGVGPSGGKKNGSLTVLLTDDDTLRDLNRRFAGVDNTTDVLAFEDFEAFPGQGERSPVLGEIAISVPQATRQAERAGRSVEREIAMLAAHGVLHLLGYDHADPEEERVMFDKTDRILERLFDPRLFPDSR